MASFAFFLFSLIYFLATLHFVAGHGYIHSIVVGGQSYPGWNPFVDPYTSTPARVVRKVLNDGFVPDTDPDIACHHGGNDGTAASASAASGTQVVFQWAYWPGDHQGPVSTYMASCNGDCATFGANDARWFKIDADGYDPSNRQWAAAKLIASGSSWTSTIPAALAPGQYLIRNEIIALHSSTPQFYPSCSQITVTGTGTGVPSGNELVSMQTLYQGVAFPDIYGDSVSFTIPGPPPVRFDGNAGGTPLPPATGTSTTSRDGAVTTSTVATASTASTPVYTSQPSKQCHLASSRKLVRRRSV
ncbi:glycosyl hydrolase family 61-domain-containing protein [Crassisporium funariophilum]|nr:glycosyl hydrolase family 61-domain-containing protein [Crassisporium funariophilum]